MISDSRDVAGPKHCSSFRVGGVSVQLAGDSEEAVTLAPSLEPFRVETSVSDIHIAVNKVDRLAIASGRQLFDSGTTWELYEAADGFQFDFVAAMFGKTPFQRLLIDPHFRDATLLMNQECLVNLPHEVEPMGNPLDELLIMHRLTQENAIELHGCGIVRPDGTGNLFVGHSGAGKSTTTRLWTEREDVEILSDDRIIVRRDNSPGVNILRLRDSSASQGNHSAPDDKIEKQTPHRAFGPVRNDKKQMRMYGTPWHVEAMYASPGTALLARIFILEHGHGNVITRLSPSQAVAELFARSFVPFHRHEYVDSALEFLQEVVDTVPCYRYSFEPDERAVEQIIQFRD